MGHREIQLAADRKKRSEVGSQRSEDKNSLVGAAFRRDLASSTTSENLTLSTN